MRSGWIVALLLVCGIAGADAEQDLLFAKRLSVRGLRAMAESVLDEMIRSGDPERVRAGHYGKAAIQKELATLARGRFLFALETGAKPPMPRAEVIAIYEGARPKIEEYVKSRGTAGAAAFLLGELLQEYAEFMTGAGYPEAMMEARSKLVSENKKLAADLFQTAIDSFTKVFEETKKKITKDTPYDSEIYVRNANAEYKRGLAHFRWGLIYPQGPNFTYHIDTAEEELDVFFNKHYEELFGAYALIYLGRCSYERMMREGDADAGETALNYFENLYERVEEKPTVPGTSNLIGEAFYWYARTANALATGAGNLKKARPIFFENTIKAGSTMRQKLRHGAKNRHALRALLEVGRAQALRGNFDEAVSLAGEVLSGARVEGLGSVTKEATLRLTDWVASVSGAGALDPGLLFQIGESLAAQGRTANAITFYEKAVAASESPEEKEKWAMNGRLKIAMVYRRDQRYIAAGEIAWALVQDYLAAGQDDASASDSTAAEACNQARLAWRIVSERTKRAVDEAQYRKIVTTFREKFPGHKENSDRAFSEAMEVYAKGKLEKAAKFLVAIDKSSNNYWRAQRTVPICYRALAAQATDPAQAGAWHKQCLAASETLLKLAASKAGDQSKKAQRQGQLFKMMSLHSLEQWQPALQAVDAFLALFPGDFPKKGLEYRIKIDAHIALGQLERAETALATFKKKLPKSSYRKGSNYDVFEALKKKYQPIAETKEGQGIAGRAAILWEERVNAEKDPGPGFLYVLGDTLADAEQWQEAAEAFDGAANAESDDKKSGFYKLRAAECAFNEILDAPPGPAKVKALNKTRALFTDVLIEKKNQEKVLKSLGDWKAWPHKDTFKKIKRKPDALLTTARVFSKSSPAGLDGRWIALRLLAHLHSFTKAKADPGNARLADFVKYWWAGTELKLNIYKEIAEARQPQMSKSAASKGQRFAAKIIFQYQKMDGPERVARIKQLEATLKTLK